MFGFQGHGSGQRKLSGSTPASHLSDELLAFCFIVMVGEAFGAAVETQGPHR